MDRCIAFIYIYPFITSVTTGSKCPVIFKNMKSMDSVVTLFGMNEQDKLFETTYLFENDLEEHEFDRAIKLMRSVCNKAGIKKPTFIIWEDYSLQNNFTYKDYLSLKEINV